ncbi:hypothetical protein C8A06_0467 [Microbacteriaceae bacterium MWH-Ta3]|nr:hypothetical protein C8A06_0467 [Microbacteriaceae bacterium MWH-Ta3]
MRGPIVTQVPDRASMLDVPPPATVTLNNRIGLWITRRVGTMWAAYAFFALSLVSLPAALASGNTLVIVAWIAQTFLQLVLLPIIIVGQNMQAAASDQRAIATYKDAGAILDETKEIQAHLAAQDAALAAIRGQLDTLQQRAAHRKP